MSDIGKFGKEKGDMHPRDARRIDPTPPRSVSKASGAKPVKSFGFTVECKHWHTAEWSRTVWSWHETAKQRDQALEHFRKKHKGWWLDHYRDPQPIAR